MTREQRYGIRSLKRDFPDDTTCLNFMFDALHSRNCSCGGTNVLIATRKQYYCSKCRKQTAVLSGTIFERSLVPLRDWLLSALLIKQGISGRELADRIGVGYKTAWRIKKLLLGSTVNDTITICRIEQNIDGSTALKTKRKSMPLSENGTKKTGKPDENTANNIALKTTIPTPSGTNNAQKIYAFKLFLGTATEYRNVIAAEKPNCYFYRLTT